MPADRPPLPRGRHALSREAVVSSQRERILRGLTEQMAESGYTKTSVADVLAAAGVSRATFYELFSSKEDAFMAAFDAAAELVVSASIADAAQEADRVARMRALVGGYVDAMAAEPALARLFTVEVYAAGPAAVQRRTASIERYASVLADALGLTSDADRFAVRAFVAATSMLVTGALSGGDEGALRALREPLLELGERLVRE